MLKRYAALLSFCWLLVLGPRAALGQPVIPQRTCATQAADDRQQALLQLRLPGYRATKRTASLPRRLQAATTYTLPVVVHLVHSGEAVGANLSAAQVQSQLDALNEDYRNLNADGALVPGAFQPLRADVQVQFVAALIDPSGRRLPEPGIDRVSRVARGFAAAPYSPAYIDDVIKPATSWNPSQYVNIWVLDLGDKLLGYAQFPDNTAGLGGLSPLGGAATTDGVVVLYSAFGRVGTLSANFDRGRTLTHELGHWLGLRHVWGDAPCADDYCADTPTQAAGNFGCPAFPHVSCANEASGDMFMNYMDYVNDGCMHLFSADQKARIQAVLAAGTPRRTELLASPALCPTVAAAAATNSGPACPGGTVQLAATGPAGATYAWAGPGGYTSTLQNPVLAGVSAAAAGTYTVTVAVASGACPGVASTTVVVGEVPPVPALAASAAGPVCPGTAVGLVAAPTSGPAPRYAWSLVSGDGLPSATDVASLTVTPTQSSVYRLTLSYPGGACTSSATISVAVALPVWTGAAGNGQWLDAGNWLGCVPTRQTDALIPVGLATPYPTITSGTAEVRTLTQEGPLAIGGGELALYGDYTGAGELRQTGGVVATRGPGTQRLRAGTYQALLIGGAGTKTIGAATISQALTLAGALLDTGPAVLTLASTAILTETDASYVLGRVQTTHVVGTAPDAFGGLGLQLLPTLAMGTTTLVRTTGPLAAGASGPARISRYYDLSAAASQNLTGATLLLSYLPHELNGLPEAQLALLKSADGGATWSNEGATQRAPGLVARGYVPDVAGRWTLGPAASLPAPAGGYAITALPVPFGAAGLSIRVTTPIAGSLRVQLYDMLGRAVYHQTLASVEVGTSLVGLPGSEQLRPGTYVLLVEQGSQQARLKVARE